MEKHILRKNLKFPKTRKTIIQSICHGMDVLDLGCAQHSANNESLDLWLHKQIKDVAKELIGVDYVKHEVEELAKRGYNVIYCDITKPITIDKKFDIIVIGNLIEHLSCFEGMFLNLKYLLKDNGQVFISTANPFFREQYFYTAFKNDIIVNKEHTCWIDPVTLDQLATRFGFTTREVFWIKEKWKLSQTIFNSENLELDNFNNRWIFKSDTGRVEKAMIPLLLFLFRIISSRNEYLRLKNKHGNDLGRLLYLRFKGVFVDAAWVIFRGLIPCSDINKHELFASVLTLNNINSKEK